jgi:hypothetical protein
LGSVLGARLAALAGNENLATEILSGEKMVAVSVASWAQPVEVSETVSGEFYVFESEAADLVLVAAPGGVALVEKSAISIIQPLPCTDDKLQFCNASMENVSTLSWLPSSKEDIYRRGVLLTAAMQLGIAEACRDRSVEYAKVREQYGKPIGAFQAIKHECAEMAVRCEAALSQIYVAAIELDDSNENAGFDITCAKVLATDAARINSNVAVQVHGGMGFTQEMDIHLFVKRAHVMDQLFGGEHRQLESLAKMAGPAV